MHGIIYTYDFFMLVVSYVLNGLAFMNLAKKAGRPDLVWMAWVPICSSIQQLLLIKKSGWWVLMYLVPIANFVFMIIWQVKLLKAFGKHGAFVLFEVFIPIVYLILWTVWGYSKDTRYTPPTDPQSTVIPA